jgi:hypothetical protein
MSELIKLLPGRPETVREHFEKHIDNLPACLNAPTSLDDDVPVVIDYDYLQNTITELNELIKDCQKPDDKAKFYAEKRKTIELLAKIFQISAEEQKRKREITRLEIIIVTDKELVKDKL